YLPIRNVIASAIAYPFGAQTTSRPHPVAPPGTATSPRPRRIPLSPHPPLRTITPASGCRLRESTGGNSAGCPSPHTAGHVVPHRHLRQTRHRTATGRPAPTAYRAVRPAS